MSVITFIYIGEEYLVGRLVEYASNAQHQYGPAVRHHATHKALGFGPTGKTTAKALLEFLVKAEGDAGGAGQIDVEGITHVVPIEHHIIAHVEGDVEHDEQQFEGCKLKRAFLVTQVGKGYALKGIDGHGYKHGPHIGRVVGIAHGRTQRVNKGKHQGHKQQRGAAHHGKGGGIYPAGVLTLLVHETEKGSFHAIRQYNQQQGRVGIQIGYDAIAATGGTDLGRVERHKQIVEETSHYARHAIDGGVLGKALHSAGLALCSMIV